MQLNDFGVIQYKQLNHLEPHSVQTTQPFRAPLSTDNSTIWSIIYYRQLNDFGVIQYKQLNHLEPHSVQTTQPNGAPLSTDNSTKWSPT